MASVRWFNACAQIALGTAAGLRERGHTVLLLVRPDSPLEARAREAALPVASSVDLTATSPGRVVRHLRALKAILAGFRPDVVNAHRSEDHLLAALALRRSGVPLVRTRADVRAPRVNPGNRMLYGRATAAHIACADFMPGRFYAPLGVAGDRVRVIRPGLDVDAFVRGAPDPETARAALELDPAARWVGLVGRFTAAKGHRVLIEAFAGAVSADPGLRLVLTGDANEMTAADLRALAHEHGIADRVVVRPRDGDVRAVLRALDLLAVPSVASEAVSRIAMEGLALGVPTAASRLNALPEVVGDAGLLVAPGDPAAWARALTRGTDPDFAARARDAGPARIRRRYDRVEELRRTEDLLDAVLGERGR